MKAKVNKKIKRPDAEWIEKFKAIPPSIASDCLNRYQAMNGHIKPNFEGCKLCGPAITIQSMSGNNMMSHLALSFAQQGDVLAIDARSCLGNAVWGGIQSAYAIKKGLAGIVIDGAIRDVAEIRDARFPVYSRGATPAGPHKGWADSVNVPIQCGGVPVNPGDLILGDDDGIAVVPYNQLEEVYTESITRMKIEESWLKQIEAGKSSLEAVGLLSTLEKMDIEYDD